MARLKVRLFWTRSPSTDVTARRITVTKGSESAQFDLGPEVSEYLIEVEAFTFVTFKTEVMDAAGNKATSDTYTFTSPDMEAPLSDTNLGHEIVGIIDGTPTPPGNGGGEEPTPPASTRRGR